MTRNPVIVLGAGATKACGGPLTDEILPAALNRRIIEQNAPVTDREELLGLTQGFLSECFHVPMDGRLVTKADCPPLPMVLSMLRRASDRGEPIGRFRGELLVKVRRAIEYAAFAVIEAALHEIPPERAFHRRLLAPLYGRGIAPAVITLNYDVIVDNAMFALGDDRLRVPDYGVDIAPGRYTDLLREGRFGELLKIHGSLNWLYCPKCHRLDLFVSSGMRLRTGKALDMLYDGVPFGDAYSCRGTPCRNRPRCDGYVSPVLITPTFVKDYENPHVARAWECARRALARADRAVIIGYSLPNDDVEVATLLMNGLQHLGRDRITVVEHVADDVAAGVDGRTPLGRSEVGQRYRAIFGEGLDWHTLGFEAWLSTLEGRRRSAFE